MRDEGGVHAYNFYFPLLLKNESKSQQMNIIQYYYLIIRTRFWYGIFFVGVWNYVQENVNDYSGNRFDFVIPFPLLWSKILHFLEVHHSSPIVFSFIGFDL